MCASVVSRTSAIEGQGGPQAGGTDGGGGLPLPSGRAKALSDKEEAGKTGRQHVMILRERVTELIEVAHNTDAHPHMPECELRKF